jgi:hypothetical protein
MQYDNLTVEAGNSQPRNGTYRATGHLELRSAMQDADRDSSDEYV